MSRVGLSVLVGIPGAGKTTFCRKVQDFLQEKQSAWRVVHFCFDNFIRVEEGCSLGDGNYKIKRKRLLECLERLVESMNSDDQEQFEQVNSDLQRDFSQTIKLNLKKCSKYLILVDDNMYYRSMRHEVFRIALKNGTGYVQLYLDVPLEQAMLRNSQRTAPVPDEIISRMWSRLERPSERFCSWEKNSLQIGDIATEFEFAVQKMLECVENPLEAPVPDVPAQPVEQSMVHKLDLLLRKRVGEIVRISKSKLSVDQLKVMSQELIEKRKSVLNDFRSGLMEIDTDLVTNEQICLLLA